MHQEKLHDMKELLTLCSPTLSWRLQKISNPVPVTVPEGVTIMFGANGAGKSTLGSIIEKGWNITTNRITTPHTEGKLPVKMIEFGDIHSLAGFHTEYYQQRLEATMNDDVPSVAELLGPRILLPRWAELTSRFSLTDITDKKVNYLSSGELRKLLLINTLLDSPKLLILDNPYIGLDAPSRDIFNDTLQEIAASHQREREALAEKSREMIREALQETMGWLLQSRMDSAIESLQQRCGEIVEDSYTYLNRKMELGEREKKLLKKY